MTVYTGTRTETGTPAYAGPVDHTAYGSYGPGRLNLPAGWNRPIYPSQGRSTAGEPSGYRAEPGRHHLYVAWVCPYAHRAAIVQNAWTYHDVNTGVSRVARAASERERDNERRRVVDTLRSGCARDLYARPAFAETTDRLPGSWRTPHGGGR